jgi:hypothetical protein
MDLPAKKISHRYTRIQAKRPEALGSIGKMQQPRQARQFAAE